ncbi:hypothetical protein Pint_00658 [Pistacia integerrima]|uniref:Uncharacterized protein n=1 Tax=Pistacia integerrima TaxID=434235 RepID=A0ACC0ZIA7_9ROSI|nr:hypothetical protein Pint_00658 [Pistacia integerrima]
MWAVSPTPISAALFPNPTQPLSRRSVVSLPRSQDDDVGGAGHILFMATNSDDVISNTNPIPKRQKQKEGEGKQLTGSDVLWALQRATIKKKKKHKKRKELSSAGSDKEDVDVDDVDYSNVKALCIKSEWSAKLNELEKQLQELSEI